jgi:hypothetical protein
MIGALSGPVAGNRSDPFLEAKEYLCPTYGDRAFM